MSISFQQPSIVEKPLRSRYSHAQQQVVTALVNFCDLSLSSAVLGNPKTAKNARMGPAVATRKKVR